MTNDSQNQLFITGCGRSGTSMVAGLFRDSNFYMGKNLHPARESNPLGFFEAPEINQLNEQILLPYIPSCYKHRTITYGCDAPRKTHTWLTRLAQETIPEASDEQRQKIRELCSKNRFCYKDTRFCYNIHEWLQHSPHAKVICVYRNPSDVVASILKECHTQVYLNEFSISVKQAFDIWASMYQHIIAHHYNKNNWLIVSYESVLSGLALEHIESFTKAELDYSFPTKSLNRSQGDYLIPSDCKLIYEQLQRLEKPYNVKTR